MCCVGLTSMSFRLCALLASTALTVMLVPASPVLAQSLLQPDAVYRFSSEFSSTWDAGQTIDGSGLPAGFDETDTHTGYENTTWVTGSNGVADAMIEWEFDQVVDLNEIHIWNNGRRSAETLDLTFYDFFHGVVGSQTVSLADPPSDTVTAQSFTLTQPMTGVKFVQAAVTASYDSSFTGLGEVAFDGVVGVQPTPVANLFQPDSIRGFSSQFSSTWAAANTIDGSGLPADFNEFDRHAGYGDTSWTPGGGSGSAEATVAFIEWEFDAPVDMTEVYLWQSNTRPTQDITLTLFDSSDQVLGSYAITLEDHMNLTPYAERFQFDQLHSGVKYVRGDFTNPYDNDYVGLSEIAFSDASLTNGGPPGIPAPGSWALVLPAAFALLRRRSH